MTDFSRSAALLGETAFRRLVSAHIAVVGVGGVGSWCAEALVRTGLGNLTLIDDDIVQPSNLNRQAPAMMQTLGRPKVEAMRERLHGINPDCRVFARAVRIDAKSPLVPLEGVDLIVDAIDSVDAKAALIRAAVEDGRPIVSSMGAALRRDPTKVVVRRFDKIEGDGLARALRQRFRGLGFRALPRIPCVCSLEPPCEAAIRASVMPVTCAFGMALAAEAIAFVTRDA